LISDGVSSRIKAGEMVSIKVQGFKNPIDTGLVEGFTVTSMIKEENEFYPIDMGKGTLQVSEFASIFQGTLDVENPTKEKAGMI
jgi:hypothetical protein